MGQYVQEDLQFQRRAYIAIPAHFDIQRHHINDLKQWVWAVAGRKLQKVRWDKDGLYLDFGPDPNAHQAAIDCYSSCHGKRFADKALRMSVYNQSGRRLLRNFYWEWCKWSFPPNWACRQVMGGLPGLVLLQLLEIRQNDKGWLDRELTVRFHAISSIKIM